MPSMGPVVSAVILQSAKFAFCNQLSLVMSLCMCMSVAISAGQM